MGGPHLLPLLVAAAVGFGDVASDAKDGQVESAVVIEAGFEVEFGGLDHG